MPNPKNLIVIEDDIAREGYSLAQEQQRVESEWDAANSYQVDLRCSRLKRDKKKLPEAEERFQRATAASREVRTRVDAFKQRTGLTMVQCYEAVTGHPWPYYKVAGSFTPITHITRSRAEAE